MEKMTELWRQTAQNIDVTSYDRPKAWSKVLKEIQPTKVRFVDFSFVRWSAAAACLVGVFLVSYLVFNKSGSENKHGIVFRTKAAETKEIVLPDSTHVWLNENSELTYNDEFLDDTIREVALHGEAFFDVVHNPRQPFIIHGDALKTRVLGTTFNLKYTKSQNNLVVLTGKVKLTYFENNVAKTSVIAEKGYQVELNGETLVKNQISDKNKIAWHTKELEFQNEYLDEVIDNIESLYHTSIILEVPERKNYRYTGVIDHLSIEEALETICFSLDLKWKKNSRGYSLYRINP
jgi:transmembrane sensor